MVTRTWQYRFETRLVVRADAGHAYPTWESDAALIADWFDSHLTCRQLDDVRVGELTRAAEDIVRFLQGEVEFERIRLADTVILYLAPEGGGGQARIARHRLEDPGSWAVRGLGGHRYSFVPPRDLTSLTTRVGAHFNCTEYPLATRVPHLADLPHVGARLTHPAPGSCLRTWTLTLVSASARRFEQIATKRPKATRRAGRTASGFVGEGLIRGDG